MRRTKPPPEKTHPLYREVWRVVDGAVADAFKMHPDYLSKKGRTGRAARRSIVKRVVGAVLGFAEQAKTRQKGRVGVVVAAERAVGQQSSPTSRKAPDRTMSGADGAVSTHLPRPGVAARTMPLVGPGVIGAGTHSPGAV